MTEREELLQTALLDELALRPTPLGEPLIQALIQMKLGFAITVDELKNTLRDANGRGLVTGLPGANEKMKWTLSDAGRHYRANTTR